MQQRPDIKTFFSQFFEEFLPTTVIELGTGDGEFIDIIHKLLSEKIDEFTIHSFDLSRPRSVTNPGINYHSLDIEVNESFIAGLIKPGCLFMCDNGNKIREIQVFSKHIPKGSVIMAHDYAHDYESFSVNKYWRTCEITHQDIREYVNEFIPFHQELMLQAGWLSLIRL